MHEALLTAINQKGNDKDQNDNNVILINKNLSETIAQIEARNQILQTKIG